MAARGRRCSPQSEGAPSRYTANSNTISRIHGKICTENAVSCIGFWVVWRGSRGRKGASEREREREPENDGLRAGDFRDSEVQD